MSHLSLMDNEVREVGVEYQLQCPHCGKKDLQEVQITNPGDDYKCKFCFTPLINKLMEWKKKVFDTLDWCDVAVFQRNTEREQLNLMIAAKKMGKRVIVEGDDDYINIPEKNSGYQYYKPRQPIIEEMMRVADGLTVTTESLKNVYLQYNKNIQVVQNTFDVELYEVTPPIQFLYICDNKRQQISIEQFVERRAGKKFICWAGSPTHQEDMELVLSSLEEILKRDDVILGMCAYVHGHMMAYYPSDKLYCFGVVPSIGWYSMLKFLQPDVWLGPVVENEFNRSKSNIKYLEAALMGSMFVGSDFDTYNQTELEGFLAKNNGNKDWFYKIRKALNVSPEERERINKHNMRVVYESYDAKVAAKIMDNFFRTGVAT